MSKGAKAVPRPRVSAEEKKWRAQDDLRTLQQVMQIKADPARLKAAQSEANAQLLALKRVKAV